MWLLLAFLKHSICSSTEAAESPRIYKAHHFALSVASGLKNVASLRVVAVFMGGGDGHLCRPLFLCQ